MTPDRKIFRYAFAVASLVIAFEVGWMMMGHPTVVRIVHEMVGDPQTAITDPRSN